MRNTKMISFFILFLGITVLFTSCKKDDNPVSSDGDELVGVWVLTKIIIPPGIEFSPESFGMQAKFELKSDRSFNVTTTDSSGTEIQTGTWSSANNKVTLKSDEETVEMPYNLSGNKLTVETVYDLSSYGMSSEQQVKLELTKQ